MKADPHTNRRGVIAVFAAALLVVLFGMVAFAVDTGYIVHARTELQRTADACALAAAARLPDRIQATLVAQSTAKNNYASVGPEVKESDIEFGFWDRDNATFTTPTPLGENTNAVRVALRRTEAAGNPVKLFFASVLGAETSDVAATATSLRDQNLCGPFVGKEWVSVPGNPLTDSYNSSEGGYSLASARDRGGRCSDGPININGNAVIRGDARAGKEYEVSITGKATVTGNVGSRLKPLNLPPVDASEALIDNDNDLIPLIPQGKSWISPVDARGNFLLDGTKSIELPPGTYVFNNFTLKGQSTFTVSGPTTIYVLGNLERAGGALVSNDSQDPSDLQFLMTGGTAIVTSENDFYGVIYAPNTAVTIDGTADLYGAVVGKTLTITGSGTAHYDESLDMIGMELPTRTALVD